MLMWTACANERLNAEAVCDGQRHGAAGVSLVRCDAGAHAQEQAMLLVLCHAHGTTARIRRRRSPVL